MMYYTSKVLVRCIENIHTDVRPWRVELLKIIMIFLKEVESLL